MSCIQCVIHIISSEEAKKNMYIDWFMNTTISVSVSFLCKIFQPMNYESRYGNTIGINNLKFKHKHVFIYSSIASKHELVSSCQWYKKIDLVKWESTYEILLLVLKQNIVFLQFDILNMRRFWNSNICSWSQGCLCTSVI